jgi:hypothetical protein
MSKLSSEKDCVLLVASCDAYRDLWRPFFALLRQYWPDCPFPVFLGAERTDSGQPGVVTLFSDGGLVWSRRILDYLTQLSATYVLVTLEDFFLRSVVSTSKVLQCFEFACGHDAVQVRLIPRPRPTNRISGESLIGESAVGSPYRLCTQAAIWNRRALIDLLRADESIWEFELNGNVRASANPSGFYSVWRPVLPYQGVFAHHVVEKGKWLPHEKWIFERKNIGCDFARRDTLPWRQAAIYHLALTIHRLLNILPWRRKDRVLRALKAAGRPFLGRSLDRLKKPPPHSTPSP